MNKKSYGVACTTTTECNTGLSLYCTTTSGTCKCPLNLNSKYCDCYRVSGNESFWNSSWCQPAGTYNDPCQNASTSYMCQTLTQGLVCNGTTGSGFKCQCPYLQYFDNTTTNTCQNQGTWSDNCTDDIECQNVFGLLCADESCEYYIILLLNFFLF